MAARGSQRRDCAARLAFLALRAFVWFSLSGKFFTLSARALPAGPLFRETTLNPEISNVEAGLVSILLPLKDEEEALPPFFAALSAASRAPEWPARFELLFVDDGSIDRTADLVVELASAHPFATTLIRHLKNEGIGAALKSAAQHARGSIFLTYDVDLPYPLEDLPTLLRKIEGGAFVATLSPWHACGRAEGLSPARSWPSRTVSFCYRLRFRRRSLATWTAGVRAWRREAFLACLPRRPDFTATAEMMVRAVQLGLDVQELPSTLKARTAGKSKLRLLRTALRHLVLLTQGPGNAPASGDALTQIASVEILRREALYL